jgi:dihydroxy-acid dehydratase
MAEQTAVSAPQQRMDGGKDNSRITKEPVDVSGKVITQTNKLDDYDISRPLFEGAGHGLRQGLTSYGDAHFSLFLRKAFIKALGYSEDALSRPIVGIANTSSGFSPCHANLPQLVEAVRRGVQLSGGLAIDFPTISLHESFASPTSMYLRNLMSMDTEEMIRAQPMDAVVLIGGELTSIRPCFTSTIRPFFG